MSPDWNHLSSAVPAAQRGFLLPVAMFIVVAMGLASLALWRTTSQSSVASVQELLTVQALYAAESGVQSGLSELFYPNASARAAVDNRCTGMSQSLDFAGISGLNLCSAEVSCQLLEPGMYRIEVSGACGNGVTRAVRDLEVQARF